MAKDCTVRIKTLDTLKEKEVISNTRKIQDYKEFYRLNDLYTKHAQEKYGLPTYGEKLFLEKEYVDNDIMARDTVSRRPRRYDRAVPNDKLFVALEVLVDDYKKRNPGSQLELNFPKKISSLVSETAESIFTNPDRDSLETNNTNNTNENREILFGRPDVDSKSAVEVLENILLKKVDLTKDTSKVLQNLVPLLRRSKAKVKIVSNESMAYEEGVMEYDLKTNTIKIPKASIEFLDIDSIASAFLHEGIHSVTVHSLKMPETTDQSIFTTEINEIFEKYQALSNNSMEQGFENKYEFVAEIMSNPEFQRTFKSLEGRTLWQQFIDSIRSLLGLSANSEYGKVLEYISQVALESNYNGDSSIKETIFPKKQSEETIEYYELTSVSAKIEKITNTIKDNLADNLRKYDRLVKQYEKSDNIKNIKKAREELERVANNIGELEDSLTLQGVSTYVDFINKELDRLTHMVDNIDPTEADFEKNLSMYKSYVASYGMIGEIQKFVKNTIRTNKRTSDLPDEDLQELAAKVVKIDGSYNSLISSFESYTKEFVFNMINNRQFQTKEVKAIMSELRQEYKQRGIKSVPREKWVLNEMDVRKDEVDRRIESKARAFVENPLFDISAADLQVQHHDDINSGLVQVFSNMMERLNEQMRDETTEIEFEFDEMFQELVKSKQTGDISKLYSQMYDKDSEGRSYLKGDYSIKFHETYNKLKEEYDEGLQELYDSNATEKEIKEYKKNHKFKEWIDDNVITINSVTPDGLPYTTSKPKDKWKNKLPAKGSIDYKMLMFAREKLEQASKNTYGINSLVLPMGEATYYKLPSITKSELERLLGGELKGAVKDRIRNLKGVREDETHFEQTKVDASNNPIQQAKIHYRAKLEDPNEQSLDLMTILILEAKAAVTFKAKNTMENEAQWVLDFAKTASFYTTAQGKPVVSVYERNNMFVEKAGENSNVYKKIKGMMETHIYDILHKDAGSINKFDANKVMQTIMGGASFLAMGINEVASSVNVLNAKSQLALEVIGGQHVKRSGVVKAEAKYARDLPNIIRDISNPVKKSFTNQFFKMFDIDGNLKTSQRQSFMQNTFAKTLGNSHSVLAMQSMGEHWSNNVLGMSLLDNIKAMDSNYNLINKEGKPVKTEKEAASLLDMLEMDKKGILRMNSKVAYTTQTKNVKYNEGGKELVNRYIKKKMRDMIGNYEAKGQGELAKHGWYKMILMFRKYLIPFFMARYRGFRHVGKNIKELDEHQLFYNEALGEYEVGTYTTVARTFYNAFKAFREQKNLSAIRAEFNKMEDFERAQFLKGVSEIGFSILLVNLSMIAASLAADDGDEDDELTWFLILNARRLASELGAFYNIKDQWRLTKSPIASAHYIESMFGMANSLLSFWNWGDEYESGPNKGMLKIQKNIYELTPFTKDINTNYKMKFDSLVYFISN